MLDSTELAYSASAIVHAARVVPIEIGSSRCACCGRIEPFAHVIVEQLPSHDGNGAAVNGNGSASNGHGAAPIELPRVLAGICFECVTASSERRNAELSELVTAATRVDALLKLIRHRADRLLVSWWGGIGACSIEDVDSASVGLRRVIERLAIRH